MRYSMLCLALVVAAVGCKREDDERRQTDGTLRFERAMFGTLYTEKTGIPDGISLTLGDSAMTCAGFDRPPDGSHALVVEVWNPSTGDCAIGERTGDVPTDRCVASARLVRIERGRAAGTTRASEGVVRILSASAGLVTGEIDVVLPGAAMVKHCEFEGGGGPDGEWTSEGTCTCVDPDGSTWTCSQQEDEPTCCLRGEGTTLTTTFEATYCEAACACTTNVPICPCGVSCDSAPEIECGRTCEAAARACETIALEGAALAGTVLEGFDCASLDRRCEATCEMGLLAPMGRAAQGCFELSSSSAEWMACMEASSCGSSLETDCLAICERRHRCGGASGACSEAELAACQADLAGVDREALMECVFSADCSEFDACFEDPDAPGEPPGGD